MTSASEGSCSWIANTATWVIPTTTFSIDCTRLACSVSPKISSVNFVTYFGSVLVRRNSQHAKGMACPPHEGFRYHCSSALILHSNIRKDLRGCISVSAFVADWGYDAIEVFRTTCEPLHTVLVSRRARALCGISYGTNPNHGGADPWCVVSCDARMHG